uniref:Calpain catalytic domain-containing protein n=1 Tax=Steinernema glaseri TaxID=37863 RepID=A0A1I7YI39_9BILA
MRRCIHIDGGVGPDKCVLGIGPSSWWEPGIEADCGVQVATALINAENKSINLWVKDSDPWSARVSTERKYANESGGFSDWRRKQKEEMKSPQVNAPGVFQELICVCWKEASDRFEDQRSADVTNRAGRHTFLCDDHTVTLTKFWPYSKDIQMIGTRPK